MTSHPVIRHIQQMTAADVTALLGRDHIARRASDYVQDGRIEEVWVDGGALRAHVAGSKDVPYHCVIRLHDGELEPECSCPYRRGTCWHVGAVLLSLIGNPAATESLAGAGRDPGRPEEPSPSAAEPRPRESSAPLEPPVDRAERSERRRLLRDRLLGLPKSEICELLADLGADDAMLEGRIAVRAGDPANLDLRLFRQAARAALRPGRPLTRWESPRVAADMREIATSVGRLVVGGEPELALGLLLETAWMTWQRIDEADDRDGALAQAARDILFDWVRRWSDLPSRDRPQLARELFGWLMEDGGRTLAGVVLEARESLGPIGLETLQGLLRPVLEARLATRSASLFGEGDEAGADPVAQRVRAALREVAEARSDLDAFLEHCDAEGAHGAEILAAAARLSHEGRLADALRWVDRGRRRASGSARAEIDDLRIALLSRLDRRREAIEAAWDGFLAEPGEASYRRLIHVVDEHERHEWRRRALDHAEAGLDASAFVDVCLAAGEIDRLAHRLDGSPGFVLAAAPEVLARAATVADAENPRAAGRLHLHLAGRLLAEGDARQYDRARGHLVAAKQAHERAGERQRWVDIVARLEATHAVVRGWSL